MWWALTWRLRARWFWSVCSQNKLVLLISCCFVLFPLIWRQQFVVQPQRVWAQSSSSDQTDPGADVHRADVHGNDCPAQFVGLKGSSLMWRRALLWFMWSFYTFTGLTEAKFHLWFQQNVQKWNSERVRAHSWYWTHHLYFIASLSSERNWVWLLCCWLENKSYKKTSQPSMNITTCLTKYEPFVFSYWSKTHTIVWSNLTLLDCNLESLKAESQAGVSADARL